MINHAAECAKTYINYRELIQSETVYLARFTISSDFKRSKEKSFEEICAIYIRGATTGHLWWKKVPQFTIEDVQRYLVLL